MVDLAPWKLINCCRIDLDPPGQARYGIYDGPDPSQPEKVELALGPCLVMVAEHEQFIAGAPRTLASLALAPPCRSPHQAAPAGRDCALAAIATIAPLDVAIRGNTRRHVTEAQDKGD